MHGQGDAERMTGPGRRTPRGAALVLLAWAMLSPPAAAAAERVTPSGMPVPRYVSLKFDTVNARSGPGDDHKLLWVYHARDLPLQVVAETLEWRRVCDPEGGLGWVHRRTVDGRRTVINLAAGPEPLQSKPKQDASVRAFMQVRAVGALSRCEKGWCRVRVGGVNGWTRQGRLWGTLDAQQCR